MDITNFGEFKTGRLVRFATEKGHENYAFVPKPLPDAIFEAGKIWRLIVEARDAVARLEQIKGILDEPFLLLRPLQQREALRSSKLEGTITLPEDLILFDLEQEQQENLAPSTTHQRNEQREVWNYYEALRQGNNWVAQGRALDKELMLHLHKILMTNVRGGDKNPGQFRKVFVAVGSRPRLFIPPPPDAVESCIEDLCEYMTNGKCDDDLCKAFLVHYQFEAIHPFEDGNGRVGRVLLSLCISTWLHLTLPWLYLSDYFEKNRREYTENMYRISTEGEWTEWIEFCLHATIAQSHSTIERCLRLRDLRDSYMEKFGNLSKRMHQIIGMLFVRPVLRIPYVAKMCDVTQETARQDLIKLCNANVLTKLEKGKPRAYACFDILDVAYGDEPIVSASFT